MGRRKKTGRGNTRRDVMAAFRRILEHKRAEQSSRGGGLDQLIDDVFEVSPIAPRVVSKSKQWFEAVDAIQDALPDDFADVDEYSSATFRIEGVYSKGEIQGTWQDGDDTYQVFANVTGSNPPAGCSCEESDGENPCIHVADFLYFLGRQLLHETSPLSLRINRGDFTPGVPKREQYHPDRELLVINRLDGVLNVATIHGRLIPEASVELPPMAATSAERLAWSVSGANGQFQVQPLIQQQKKRGSGFTKGRKLSLDRLRSDSDLPLLDADREIVSLIKLHKDPYGYSVSWVLDSVAAVERLVGHPNVFFDGEPCEVKRGEFCVDLVQQDGKWDFVLADARHALPPGSAYSVDQILVFLDAATPQVYCGRLPACGFQPLRTLLNLPSVSDKHTERLFEKARELQAVLPLKLPESVGGKIVQDSLRPALLLRSRSDGSLDYGLRVRNADGRLFQPGGVVSFSPDTVDGKRVQRQRNTTAEVESCLALAEDLEIDPCQSDHWNGSIRDFGSGLKLLEALPALGDRVDVLWDESGEQPVKVLGHLSSKNVRVDITSKRNWFGISGSCDFGNRSMPLDQLLRNLPTGSNSDDVRGDYIRVVDGQWARISKSLRMRLEKLRDVMHEDRKSLLLDATAAPAIRDLMDGEVEVQATKNWHECLARLSRAEKLDPQLPENLQADLRDYQIEGYKWLRRLAEWGVGGVLADDMGLGKTLQTLAVLLDRALEGPTLVIAPTSVGFNWVRECERFAPDLCAHLYRETDRADFLTYVGPRDLVVCSYALALRDREALGKVGWGTLVLDEAQAVKNSRSKTAQAIAEFEAKWTVALTGTPVENHLGELWSLFQLVSPGVFGGWEQFRRRYAVPIEKHADPDARGALASRLQPFVLRRTKSQVLTELPPRTEINLYVEQSAQERDQYERVRLSAIGEIDQIAALQNTQDQRFKLLALLTRLRQFACHPGIVNKEWTGSSAKLDQLCETMVELKEEGHRALIFSQFTQHLDLIRKALDERGITFRYLDGSTPAAARQQQVDAFQAGEGDAFLISLKAGGTGLNLTAADYVIHMDPWWNPAVEDQATDRAHRYGQDKPVMVYRIITRGTIEEEILSLHGSKRDLVAGVLEGTTAAAKMNTNELIEMLRGTPD